MPWVVITLVAGLLVVLAAARPADGAHLVGPGAASPGTPERTFYEDFREGYPLLAGAEVLVVTTAPADQVEAWAATAADRPGVESVDPVNHLDTA